jgi:hypothetical protein
MHQLWQHRNGVWYVLHGPRLKNGFQQGQKAAARLKSSSPSSSPEARNRPSQAKPSGPSSKATGTTTGRPSRGKRPEIRHSSPDRSDGDLAPEQLTPTVIKRYAADRGAAAGTILREVGILRAALAGPKPQDDRSAPGNPQPGPSPASPRSVADQGRSQSPPGGLHRAPRQAVRHPWGL